MLALLSLLLFSGTVAESGHLYVYAQRDTPSKSWTSVTLDDERMAEIKSGVYFTAEVSAGQHMVSIDNGVPVAVMMEAGHDTYVRLGWHYQVGESPVAMLQVIDSDTALRELRFLSYVDAKRIHSSTVLRSAPTNPTLRTR